MPIARSNPQSDELARLSDDSTIEFQKIAKRMIAASATSDDAKMQSATSALVTLFANTLSLADLMGRRRVILQARSVVEGSGLDLSDPFAAPIMFAASTTTISDVVNPTRWEDAVTSIVERTPELAKPVIVDGEIEPRYKAIQRLYKDKHGFGLAKSFEIKVTERVQDVLKRTLDYGLTKDIATLAIKELGAFTQSYSEMVYRTNINSTYTAGTFEQMSTPESQLVFGALEFISIADRDTRPNHFAAHGLIAPATSKVWNQLSPPLYYNCRCSVQPVDRWTLEEEGLLMSNGQVRVRLPNGEKLDRDIDHLPGAGPDQPNSGFGRRPNRATYG